MAYTGFDGQKHAVFVARTTALSQPWQKWTGFGWGGSLSPTPIVSSGTPGWGVGQPSLVLQSGMLSIYYDFHDGVNWQTRLATAQLRDDNVNTWPAGITGKSTVFVHPGLDRNGRCGDFYDSTDVAYHDGQKKYVALATDTRNYATSSLAAYESSTGASFTKALTLATDGGVNPIEDHSQNAAFVRDPSGHIAAATPSAIVYGYGITTCPDMLLWQPVGMGAASTGWVNEPLSPASGH
jgi:hypothetical protein